MPRIRPRPSILIAAAGLTLALPTTAAAAPSEAAQPAKRVDPEQRVCKTIKVTGSQIRQRVCRKQKEWDRMREESQEVLNRAGGRVTNPDPQ